MYFLLKKQNINLKNGNNQKKTSLDTSSVKKNINNETSKLARIVGNAKNDRKTERTIA